MPQTLWNRGFIALLVTQFTVAFNDNAFRWLLVPIGKEYANGDFIRLLGGVFLVIPFLLWTSIAGYVTDKFSRRNAIIWCKSIELFLLAAAVGFITLGPPAGETAGIPLKLYFLLGILFLLGSQAAFFSPSKYGTIPDLVPETQISAANGIVSLLTMIACVSGQVLGGYVFAWTSIYQTVSKNGESATIVTGIPGGTNVWITVLVLVGMAAAGLCSSFFIPKMKPVDPAAKFPVNFVWQTFKDIRALFSHRTLFWVAAASAFFWGLAALAQNNIDKYASEFLMVRQQHVTLLAAVLTIGIGVGAVVCGYLSGKRIELGLVPIGAFLMGFFILLLGFTPEHTGSIGKNEGSPLSFPYLFGAAVMILAGLGAGLYDVPLAAYIQKKSPAEQRGRMIAAYNFCTFTAMLLFMGLGFAGAAVFNSAGGGRSSLLIWIAAGVFTMAVSVLLAYHFAGPFLIFTIRSLLHIIYRPKFVGTENVPAEGGALLVCNHVSLLDGLILYAASPRKVRFIAYDAMIPKFLEPLVAETGLIKIALGNPKNVIKAIRQAKEALQNGEVVGIFAEGGITRNGQMKAFEPGFLTIIKGLNVPVIPCHINGLHESMFGYRYGDKKTIFRPRKLLTDVIISFGKAMFDVKYPQQVQLAVQELGVDSLQKYNRKRLPVPAQQIIRTCKKRKMKLMFADSTGIELTGWTFLTAALSFRFLLRKYVLGSRTDEPHVGILTPMSVGGSVLNAALALDRRVPVNLNFTFGSSGINDCIRQAGIKHVLTSRKVIARFPDLKAQLDAEIVCSEDLLKQLSGMMKLFNGLKAVCIPAAVLEYLLGLRRKEVSGELATLIYTSGSTGQPKGVMLTNDNIAEVGRGFIGAMMLNEKDTALGFLPFFHAFGFMGNYYLPILCGGAGVFHFSPLEPKKVGELARKYPVTFMPSTPTFLRNFWRRCPKEDFAHISTVMCGAEKLPADLIEAWEEKYGIRPGEGFGATELSPLPATNVPDCRTKELDKKRFHCYRKDGSIGRATCNVVVKIIDLETGADLPPNETGMITVKGPIVMKGYYKQPELTADVLKNGWYITGDVGKMDEDGFIWITGRQTRISKIGGEMVPHVLIEEEMMKIISSAHSSSGEEIGGDSSGPVLAVTAVPHPAKGEQIIVLYRRDLRLQPGEIIEQMLAKDLPRLWIPHADGFVPVDSIPVLGTGKLDLAAVKRKAEELKG
jgi:acyl-[acyl-carrier-protein]-phospholipid O-acyltransferase/long-chain-fatty-acid--[acyl-carrier-protein] ligase